MSNALAVASVTEMLRRRLSSAFAQASADFPKAVQNAGAFTQRPGGTHGTTTAGADIMLYRTSAHPQWRTCDLGTRSADGTVTQKPLLGLLLRYLVTTFGDEAELEPEQLLGIAVTALHTRAPLARDEIAAAKVPTPTKPRFLSDMDLEAQPELVKFSVLTTDDEEVARVWSMMPVGTISPAILVEASVVLVEPQIVSAAPLPVLERTLGAVPTGRPLVVRVAAETGGPGAPIYPGQPAVIHGLGLAASGLRVEIDGVDVPPATVTVIDDEQLRFVVPATTLAGARGLRVIHDLLGTPPATVLGAVSAVVPMVVRPRVTSTSKTATKVRVNVQPPIGVGQAVEVLLSSGGTTIALPGVRATPNRIDAPRDDVAAGTYVVRARVDGVESLPTRSAPTGPIDGPTQAL